MAREAAGAASKLSSSGIPFQADLTTQAGATGWGWDYFDAQARAVAEAGRPPRAGRACQAWNSGSEPVPPRAVATAFAVHTDSAECWRPTASAGAGNPLSANPPRPARRVALSVLPYGSVVTIFLVVHPRHLGDAGDLLIVGPVLLEIDRPSRCGSTRSGASPVSGCKPRRLQRHPPLPSDTRSRTSWRAWRNCLIASRSFAVSSKKSLRTIRRLRRFEQRTSRRRRPDFVSLSPPAGLRLWVIRRNVKGCVAGRSVPGPSCRMSSAPRRPGREEEAAEGRRAARVVELGECFPRVGHAARSIDQQVGPHVRLFFELLDVVLPGPPGLPVDVADLVPG